MGSPLGGRPARHAGADLGRLHQAYRRVPAGRRHVDEPAGRSRRRSARRAEAVELATVAVTGPRIAGSRSVTSGPRARRARRQHRPTRYQRDRRHATSSTCITAPRPRTQSTAAATTSACGSRPSDDTSADSLARSRSRPASCSRHRRCLRPGDRLHDRPARRPRPCARSARLHALPPTAPLADATGHGSCVGESPDAYRDADDGGRAPDRADRDRPLIRVPGAPARRLDGCAPGRRPTCTGEFRSCADAVDFDGPVCRTSRQWRKRLEVA